MEIGRDIAVAASDAIDDTPVRQSRRIAQIKIKEQADRRRLEEENLKLINEKQDPKKRKKQKVYLNVVNANESFN